MSRDPFEKAHLTDVRQAEWEEIRARREKAGLKDRAHYQVPRDLVGVTLSGGGVRSCMFNVGVLQGLEELGLLRYVDYLATVSGGGFIGGCFTSQYNERIHGGSTKGQEGADDPGSPLKEDGDGQISSVIQLTRSGGYLNGPLELGVRVATGVILHVMVLASLLVATCASLAWIWRLPDMPFIEQWALRAAHWIDTHPLQDVGLFGLAAALVVYVQTRSPRRERKWDFLVDVLFWPAMLALVVGEGAGYPWALVIAAVCSALVGVGLFLWKKPCPRELVKEAWPDFVVLALWLVMFSLLLGGLVWGLGVLGVALLIGLIAVVIVYWDETPSNRLGWKKLVEPYKRTFKRPRWKTIKRLGWKSWPGLAALAIFTVFVIHEGGAYTTVRDWYVLSDFVRAFVMFGVLCAVMNGISRNRKRKLSGLFTACAKEYVTHLEERRKDGGEPRPLACWKHELPDDGEGKKGPCGVVQCDPEAGWLAKADRWREPILWLGLILSLVTLTANGDTDLGPRVGSLLGRIIPGLGERGSLAPFRLQVRNNPTIQQWISSTTHYLLFIQLASGVIPLLLPRQFAASAKGDASSFKRSTYRAIVFLLFISLPILVYYFFLRENVSNALVAPAPIQRLAVARGPMTGRYAELISIDQWARLRWALSGVTAFLLLNLIVDLNRTSLHQYYRRRLNQAYLNAFPTRHPDPDEPDGHVETRLKDVEVGKTGAPYPLISATMNEIRPGSNSLDSGCNFIFSPLFCGWSRNHVFSVQKAGKKGAEPHSLGLDPAHHRSCFIDTAAYDGGDPNHGLRLVDAMAISGAAISPSQSRSLLDTILLLAANARLGQWMVSPGVELDSEKPVDRREREAAFRRLIGGRRKGIPRMSPLRLIRSMAAKPERRPFCFLSDGAHYDNLGLELLFERRCRLIVASDVSHDPDYAFSDLIKTLRRLRAIWGIEFYLDVDINNDEALPLFRGLSMLGPADFLVSSRSRDETPAPAPISRSHHLTFVFRYPAQQVPAGTVENPQCWGLLVVLKPSLDGAEDRTSPGLFTYSKSHSDFPMDSDLNQFFDENQCEYYRELGHHIACSTMYGPLKGTPEFDDVLRAIKKPPAPAPSGPSPRLAQPAAANGAVASSSN